MKGQVEEQARRLPNISEAEEELASAEQQLDRIRRLDETLERTLGFLQEAEAKVYRDIAPVLAETVRSWLPKVTSNRYEDTRVDPDSLAVKVRGSGGPWRDAARLSHGTAEQIYLLLRDRGGRAPNQARRDLSVGPGRCHVAVRRGAHRCNTRYAA